MQDEQRTDVLVHIIHENGAPVGVPILTAKLSATRVVGCSRSVGYTSPCNNKFMPKLTAKLSATRVVGCSRSVGYTSPCNNKFMPSLVIGDW